MSLGFTLVLLFTFVMRVVLTFVATPQVEQLKKKKEELEAQVRPAPDMTTLRNRYADVQAALRKVRGPRWISLALAVVVAVISAFRPASLLWRSAGLEPTGLSACVPDPFREMMIGASSVESIVGVCLAAVLVYVDQTYLGAPSRDARTVMRDAHVLFRKHCP